MGDPLAPPVVPDGQSEAGPQGPPPAPGGEAGLWTLPWLTGRPMPDASRPARKRRSRAWLGLALATFVAFYVLLQLVPLAAAFPVLMACQWASAQFIHRHLEVDLKRPMKFPLGLVLGLVTEALLVLAVALDVGR